MTEINDQICECAGELVGFLYGELTEIETRKFERHMQDCAACKVEYAAFGQMRQSIVAWRDESLGRNEETVFAPAAVQPSRQRRPSALAAIREFLTLSPAWLKGAAALASVLFCLLAAVAVTHLIEKKSTPDAVASNEKKYTERELVERIAEIQKSKSTVAPAPASVQTPQPVSGSQTPVKVQVAADAQKLRRPLSRQERQELAADLRLSSRGDDDDLDLTGDTINNQRP